MLIRKPVPLCLPDAIVQTIPLRSDLHKTLSALICWPTVSTGFSEVDSGSCDPVWSAFSVATRGVYFREC